MLHKDFAKVSVEFDNSLSGFKMHQAEAFIDMHDVSSRHREFKAMCTSAFADCLF